MKPVKIAMVVADAREVTRNRAGLGPSFGTAPSALLEGFAGMHGVEIDVISFSRVQLLGDHSIAPNIRWHNLVVPRVGWRLTGFAGCVFSLRNFLHELSPDIVHGQGTEAECAITAALSGYPSVVTVHGIMNSVRTALCKPWWSHAGLAAMLEKVALHKTDSLIALSEHSDRVLERFCARRELIPNAVSSCYFNAPLSVARSPGEPLIVTYVANIHPYKGQVELMDGIFEAGEAGGIKLRFAGSIPKDTEYGARFLAACKAATWCEHLGSLNKSALVQAYDQSDVLLHASFEDNCPMAIIEARAMGLPVVAYGVGGIPGLLRNLIDAEVVPANDVVKLIEVLRRFYLLKKSGEAFRREEIREEARARFAPAVIARQHLEFYHELLASI